MEDYRLTKLREELVRLRLLAKDLNAEVRKARYVVRIKVACRIAATVEGHISTYLFQICRHSFVEKVRKIHTEYRLLLEAAQTTSDIFESIVITVKKIWRVVKALAYKVKKFETYDRRVMEEVGPIISRHIPPDYTIAIRYRENERLDVYVGLKGQDPLGEGHGHYVFILRTEVKHVFTRHPISSIDTTIVKG